MAFPSVELTDAAMSGLTRTVPSTGTSVQIPTSPNSVIEVVKTAFPSSETATSASSAVHSASEPLLVSTITSPASCSVASISVPAQLRRLLRGSP